MKIIKYDLFFLLKFIIYFDATESGWNFKKQTQEMQKMLYLLGWQKSSFGF